MLISSRGAGLACEQSPPYLGGLGGMPLQKILEIQMFWNYSSGAF